MSVLHHESILETIYDEVVEESLNALIKGITEEDLDQELISQTVNKRFEERCQ